MNPVLRRPTIGYLTSCDPKDKRSWSGTHFFMTRAIEKHCGDVFFVGPLDSRFFRFGEKLNEKSLALVGKKYDYTHSTLLSLSYGRMAQEKIRGRNINVIFAPAGSTEVAHLNTSIPIVYLSDVTFPLIHEYYPWFSNFLPISVWEATRIEARAIRNARFIIYPTEWAARSAQQEFHAEPSKIRVIPFGANLEEVPSRDRILNRTKSAQCKLLFVGVEWERKGGEIAFETLLRLEDHGMSAELIVCGCTPPDGLSHQRMTVIPFLDKNDERQREMLDELFLRSDFLLLPTRSEAFGIVYCEAAAFGLPVITTDTGGVSGVIRNGENGFMLPLNEDGSGYAKVISQVYSNEELYLHMVRSSRKAFEETLNWDAWATEFTKLIYEI
jgi:glycosyltransferase involved in cell wall biosynthesis